MEVDDMLLDKKGEALPEITASQFLRRLQGAPKILGESPCAVISCRGKRELVVVTAEYWDQLVELVKAYREDVDD